MKSMTYETFAERMGKRNRVTLKSSRMQVYAEMVFDEDIGIRLGDTYILLYKADGETVELDTEGWYTPTTKSRMNDYLPHGWSIYQEAGQWYLSNRDGREWAFADKMTINYRTGEVFGAATKDDLKKKADRKKAIKKYADAFIKALRNGEVGRPSVGDCMSCVNEGAFGDDHIQLHIEEGYYVPSLLMNATKFHPVSRIAESVIYALMVGDTDDASYLGDMVDDQIRKSLVKYLSHHFDKLEAR